MTNREFDIREMLWNCEMARLWLENHWKHLGPKYNKSYYQRMKEAEWHIDFALMVANNANWSEDEQIEKKLKLKGRYRPTQEEIIEIHKRHRINQVPDWIKNSAESYESEMYK